MRLDVLELRAEGKRVKEIAEEVGVSAPYVSQLATKYNIKAHKKIQIFR